MRPRTRTATVVLLALLASVPAMAGFSGTNVFLPSVGAKPGSGGSVWYTTVWVNNPGSNPANVTFSLLERDKTNATPLVYNDTIPPGDTRKYDNAVQTMFGVQVFGAIRVSSTERVVVNGRIYNQAAGTAIDASVGQFFAGVPASFAIGSGEKTRLLGVFQTTPAADSDFRYNFGAVETSGGTAQLKVAVLDPTGTELGSKTYPIPAFGQIQKAFKDEFPAISTTNATLEVSVESGDGKVVAFGSGVANASQDPSTFEMQYRDSLLAENSAGGGVSEVIAGAGLTGGGTSASVTLDVGAGDGIAVGANLVSLADAGVTTAKLAPGAVTAAKLSATGATNGKVLKYSNGLVWADDTSGGLTLPFSGQSSTASNTDLFYLRNTGAGRAFHAEAGSDTAIWGKTSSGWAGVSGEASSGFGVYGFSSTAPGMLGKSNGHDGVQGVSGGSGRSGAYGESSSSSGFGVFGRNTSKTNWGYLGGVDAVHGEATSGLGVYGKSIANSTAGYLGGTYAVYGENNANLKTAIRGATSGNTAVAVEGIATGTNGIGVGGISNSGTSAWGVYGASTSGWAGYFNGKVNVTGNLSKGGGSFKIDHPLDPENRYLYHSFVESPDMMNIYNGVVVLDDKGEAVVEMPEYFEALNRDFRYQLTCIGGFAPVYVGEEVADRRFRIAGGRPGLKVSWQVTGIRQDAYANANRIPVEEDKPADERGYLLHPEAFGRPESHGVTWLHQHERVEQDTPLRAAMQQP